MKKNILIALFFFVLSSCGLNKDLGQQNKLVVSQDKYYIYYDNEVIELPKGTYITKENKIEDYFSKFFVSYVKDEKKLLSDLNRYFPHKINGVQEGNKPQNSSVIPIIKVENKQLIDSVKLAKLLAGETGEALVAYDDSSEIVEVKDNSNVQISLEGKLVSILNANGIAGFAKKLGRAFESNLKMKYTAENYSENLNMTYVINHKLSDEELSKFINSTNIKYVKIKKDDKIKPEADVVLITGNDANVNYTIEVKSINENSDLKELLHDYKVNVVKVDKAQDVTVINYKAEDILIAKKLLGYIPSAKLVEDNTLDNKIVITTNK
ncbi:hypothetical protein [Caviibacter abscessus]|uniref:hypothetical protein n=1 Tax=Caviibacter abscessus TaxID=1766719 RepID=UPI00082B92C9|nr:hypothetical protein [Caviibacter abscessus]